MMFSLSASQLEHFDDCNKHPKQSSQQEENWAGDGYFGRHKEGSKQWFRERTCFLCLPQDARLVVTRIRRQWALGTTGRVEDLEDGNNT